MAEIIPALIPHSFEEIKKTLMGISAFSKAVQIDLVDGQFVPFTSWPYLETSEDIQMQFQKLSGVTLTSDIEIDAMVLNPELHMETWIQNGVSRIIIHIESTSRLDDILGIDRRDVQLGLSLNNDSSLSLLLPHQVSQIDFIQVMGIAQIGAQGQAFDERVIERIKTLKVQYRDLAISVDGSVNATTLPLLLEAGATRFVVGSAILQATDARSAYESLIKLIPK